MIDVPKVMVFFAIIISMILYWATSNVCRYNFALERHTDILNIVTEEIDPSLGNAKYFTYSELNCNEVDLEWSNARIIYNLKAISVLVYQYLSTDIKGNPN